MEAISEEVFPFRYEPEGVITIYKIWVGHYTQYGG